MRPIKFRAWDYDNKCFVTQENSSSETKLDYKTNNLLHWNNYILLQFTGLMDKKGKEIYEGDIVAGNEQVASDTGEPKEEYIEIRSVHGFVYADKTKGTRWYGRKIYEVYWENKSCGFEPFSDSLENCGHCGGGKNSKDFEVIGNIYENPELLTNLSRKGE